MSLADLTDSGVGASAPPPTATPPTGEGGYDVLRFETPAADDYTWQQTAHYNYLNADRPIVYSGQFRVLGIGKATWAFGFCADGAVVLTANAFTDPEFVGFYINTSGVLYFRCGTVTEAIGTIEEGVFYPVGLICPPLRGSSHRVFVNRLASVVASSDIPAQNLGLAVCVATSRIGAGAALIEFSRMFAMQDTEVLLG